MEHLSISEQLMYSTVRIECNFLDGTGTGTGFFMNLSEEKDFDIPVIVTNKHVVDNAISGKIIFTLQDADGNPDNHKHFPIEISNFHDGWIRHPDDNVDLCIMTIAHISNYAQEAQKPLFLRYIDLRLIPSSEQINDFKAIENIIMVGYPNGIWDSVNNLPVMRKGITATHPKFDYEGQSIFMIDAACFPGSSGSPVFILDESGYTDKVGNTYVGATRIILLGVLFAGPQHTAQGEVKVMDIPMSQREIVLSQIPNNLGFVIKSSKILDFKKLLR